MRVDFTNVSMDNFTLLEPGEYVLRVNNAGEKTSSKGNPMIEVEFQEEQTGTKLRDYFVIKDDCLSKLKNFLSDIGQPFEGVVEILPFQWIGERVKAKISVEDYTKKDGTPGKRNKIGFYSPVANKAPSEATNTEEAELAADSYDVPF